MKKLVAILSIIFFAGCYKEKDYNIDSDANKHLFHVTIEPAIILADSFSTSKLTIAFDNSVDSSRVETTLNTTSGIFVESNAKTYTAKPKYDYDKKQLILIVNLRSSASIDTAKIVVTVAGFSKTDTILFTQSFPDNISLSANTLSVKPKNNSDGEILFTSKVTKNKGFPSANTTVGLVVKDSSLQKTIGRFKNLSNKIDLNGNGTFSFVLGDSVANGSNYTGRLYAITSVQTSVNPDTYKNDTLLIISSN